MENAVNTSTAGSGGQIVVAGAGYAGLHVALRLSAKLRNNPAVGLTLVDRHDYHLALTELPEFIATQYFREKKLEPLLPDWRMPEGGLYFVTPTARARPAKISALADFLIAKLTDPPWSAEVATGRKPPARRAKQPKISR